MRHWSVYDLVSLNLDYYAWRGTLSRPLLIVIGLLTSALAIAGAVLPGLPTTPFVLIALWAFSRSSPALHARLHKIPVLRSAVREAHRFEERRAIRLPIKLLALAVAWGSVALSLAVSGIERPIVSIVLVVAALGASIFMWWIPTDHDHDNAKR